MPVLSELSLRSAGARLAIALLLLLAAPCALAQRTSPSSHLQGVVAIEIPVSDVDRSIAFYSQVLMFERVSDVEVWGSRYEHLEGLFGVRMRVARMRLGDEFIDLIEFLTPHGRPIPVDSRSNDRWFQHIAIIVSDMDRAYRVLRDHNVRHASTEPQLLPPYIKNAAGIRAFYFQDPDSHFLEILQFPSDKGDAKWHRPVEKLFLGIDHTAIVVSNTDDSLKFYRDALGMRLVGESENYGTEQEHLNNVFGARLRITSLRAPAGPGIELLEYLTPRDGRSMPVDSHADDLWAWQTTLRESETAPAAQSLRSVGYDVVSSDVIDFPNSTLGFARAFLVRDPDGHLVCIVGER